jgi:hypothetical protein
MSVEEENKALSRRVAEAINRGDLEAFDELFAPDLAQEFKRDIAEIKRAFPDYQGVSSSAAPPRASSWGSPLPASNGRLRAFLWSG